MAPLVQDKGSVSIGVVASTEGESVIDHLILGKPLPNYALPPAIETSLFRANVVLRQYQIDGIAWLRFLQTMNLNGALCDSMGLGMFLFCPRVP
jgi:SNF2 family DNA or RNA helicase